VPGVVCCPAICQLLIAAQALMMDRPSSRLDPRRLRTAQACVLDERPRLSPTTGWRLRPRPDTRRSRVAVSGARPATSTAPGQVRPVIHRCQPLEHPPPLSAVDRDASGSVIVNFPRAWPSARRTCPFLIATRHLRAQPDAPTGRGLEPLPLREGWLSSRGALPSRLGGGAGRGSSRRPTPCSSRGLNPFLEL